VFEERYRQIVAAVESEFARNRELHGDRIRCRPGCTDCCYHVFSISEMEADQIAQELPRLGQTVRERIESRAREYLELRLVRGERLPCPALHDGVCTIYEFRPILCRKFGMPLYNPDKPDRIFACELNFRDGEEIDDPQLVQIQTDIHQSWKQLRADYSQAHGSRTTGRLTVAHAILRTGSSTSGIAASQKCNENREQQDSGTDRQSAP
jgi:Fe-S-cluster containining protein